MITYQTEGVEMPAIKKRETTAWIKAVAETYGKKVGEIAYILLRRKDSGSKPPVSSARLLYRHHYLRLL